MRVRQSVALPRVTAAPTDALRPPAADVLVPVTTRRGWAGPVALGVAVAAVLVVVPLLVVPTLTGKDAHGAGGATRTAAAGDPLVPPASPSRSASGTPSPNAARSKASAKARSVKPAPAGTARFSVVAGPGCTGRGAYDRIGYYTGGKSGWLSGRGGYTGAGCDGRFDALPMSGTTTGDDPGLFAKWTFDPGRRHECTVAVYTPLDHSTVHVGGDPAHYSVHRVRGGAIMAGFHVDQPRTLGRWVTGRSFTADGAFYVRLDNTGVDFAGGTRTYRHVAAAQVRATCT